METFDGSMRARWRWVMAGGVLVVAALALLALIGVANTQSAPIVRRATFHVPGFPEGGAPARVALIADIHVGNRGMSPERLAAIVDQVNTNHPDLILLAGDFVTARDAIVATRQAQSLTDPLRRLAAPMGVVAVLGNHDNEAAPAAVRGALARAGITVLENQAVQRGPFAIVGIGDRYSGHDDVPASLAAGSTIVGAPIILTHSPDIVPDLPANQPLILAGHTHCGQIVLPWIGSIATRALADHGRLLYDPRYRCGIVQDGARSTVVTAGVGTGSVPVRIGAMPDWWLLTIEP